MTIQQPNPINVRALDHVVIRTVDMNAMISFYAEVLGCRLERGPGDIGLAQLRAGESLIDLVDANGPLGRQAGAVPDHGAPNMDHLCLRVQPWDENAVALHLRNHGLEVPDAADQYGATGIGPSIYISDPEGNTVELKGSA